MEECVEFASRSLNAYPQCRCRSHPRHRFPHLPAIARAVSCRAVTVIGMASSDYSARHLSVLEGLEAVRKRPGMYIGSTDSRGLMHCLWEIIDNSVDEALGGHGDRIDVVLHPDSSVEVRDTGLGISAEHLPQIFDAFWQVDQAPTRRVGGTGLGLHVTRRLVRLLGGDVVARSVLGEGSCFTIRMPRAYWEVASEGGSLELMDTGELVASRAG